MKNHRLGDLWRQAWMLLLLGMSMGRGEDFLHVVAVPIGRNPEIQWVPANDPLSAQVLVEDLRGVSDINRFGNELWWWPQERVNVVKGDLVGETERVAHVDLRNASSVVRDGDAFYKASFGLLERIDLKTGAVQELVATGGDRFNALALYEDRLYFAGGSGLVSVRVDGNDRRTEASSPSSGGLFGRSSVADIAVHGNQLVWIREGELWQMNLETKEMFLLERGLEEAPRDVAVSNTATYWIGDRKIWRRDHEEGVSKPFYQLGDTSFLGLSVVSGETYPATINKKGDVLVEGPSEGTYQLLHSEDLRDWSPLLLTKTLFSQHGKLDFLNPLTANESEVLSWKPRPLIRESYFRVLKYDLEAGLDSDADGMADYWERKYFENLERAGEGDFDGDGLSDLEEFGILTNPILTDTDGDGLPDIDEASNVYNSSPSLNDTDGDGLDDGVEVLTHGTNPRLEDSDSDGFRDDFEVANGSDPTLSESVPPRDSTVNVFSDALMVHFEFDEFGEGLIRNVGLLEGSTEVMGQGASFIDPLETRTMSGALRLDDLAFIETEISLRDLGFDPSSPELTIAFWVRPLVPQTAPLVGFTPLPNLEDGFKLSMSKGLVSPPGDSLNLSVVGSNGSQGSSMGGVLKPNVWTHIAWTFDENSKIFINGKLLHDRAGVTSPITDTGVLSIGAPARSRGSFKGDLDDFRVYNRAVSADVVALLAQ